MMLKLDIDIENLREYYSNLISIIVSEDRLYNLNIKKYLIQ